MLVFGPYRAIPEDQEFTVFNLTSMTEKIQRLPGLFVQPPGDSLYNDQSQYKFDMDYYNHVLQDPIACSSLMSILNSIYQGNKVYVCIEDYSSYPLINIVNESFMKLIQSRYDIKYSVINTKEDYEYIPKDGCDFASVRGIQMFDMDRLRFYQVLEEQRLGG